ncbi:MAG: hypothetical protein KQJ78_11035 [Deltaproteobacteria bacterium]|nr:hypothetical protein [Deltaproteobacteria bacterium]
MARHTPDPETPPEEQRPQAAPPPEVKVTPAVINRLPGEMYLGPNLPAGLVSHGQIFRGGRPVQLVEAINARPVIATLLVPLSRVPAAKAELRDSGSTLAKAYRRVAENREV